MCLLWLVTALRECIHVGTGQAVYTLCSLPCAKPNYDIDESNSEALITNKCQCIIPRDMSILLSLYLIEYVLAISSIKFPYFAACFPSYIYAHRSSMLSSITFVLGP
jgi:hypothetical protein